VPSITGLEVAERAILEGTNAARAKAGLKPLVQDARLTAAARLHAREMADLNYFSHTSPTKGLETPSDRVHAAGSLDWGAGENIAFNEETVNAVGATLMQQWLNSPPHRKNILSNANTHIGIGVYRDPTGRSYGVQNFVGRAFEINLDLITKTLNVQQLELRGRANPTLELALFEGSELLSIVPTNTAGIFKKVLPYRTNQALRLGSRKRGSDAPYLIDAQLRMPADFASGAVQISSSSESVFQDLSAELSQRERSSHVLDLRFSPAQKTVLVFEGVEETRVPVRDNAARIICPVSPERRAVKLAVPSGAQSYVFTHRFVLDCQSGRVIPGAEK
jgi:Cysteine-rich secretory protein family